MVGAAIHGRNFSAAALAASSCRPCPRPLLEAWQAVPPPILRFPSRSRAWSRHLLLCMPTLPSRRPVGACLKSSPSFGFPNKDEPSLENSVDNESSTYPKEATFDMKLPRRSLLVEFTCNSCGERSQRLINRVAYERGTVFVQCAGCLVHHKLVDNLNLVVEYDLRNDIDHLRPHKKNRQFHTWKNETANLTWRIRSEVELLNQRMKANLVSADAI